MAKPTKKVVLVIVEGQCDELLLTDRLKELYTGHNVRFEVANGDVFYNYQDKKNIPIKNTVGTIIAQFIKSRKFRPTDMLAILHIIDTDGCFISDDNVVVDESQQLPTFYGLNQIVVSNAAQRKRITTRNQERSRNIRTMNTMKEIQKIPYRLYYFSRHLEHVLFNEPNQNDDKKFAAVESFLEELNEPIEDFLARHMPCLSVGTLEENYKQSWGFISQGVCSLNRYTNVPLLFDFLNKV